MPAAISRMSTKNLIKKPNSDRALIIYNGANDFPPSMFTEFSFFKIRSGFRSAMSKKEI